MQRGRYTKKDLEFVVRKLIDKIVPMASIKGPYLERELKTKIKDIDYNRFEKEGYYRSYKWEGSFEGQEGYILVRIDEECECKIIEKQMTSSWIE